MPAKIMICTNTGHYVNNLSTIKKEKKKKVISLDLDGKHGPDQ